MTATAHALTGAVVAVWLKQPALAVPVALASHFVIDAFPHFKFDGDAVSRNRRKAFWLFSVIDVIIAITLLVLLPSLVSSHVSAGLVLACMIAAISPDLPWIYRIYREASTGQLTEGNMFTRFHIWIQWKEFQWGIVPELMWIGLMIVTLARIAR